MRVSALFLHPVKSLRAVAVQEAEVDDLGLVGDRRFLVTDPAGNFLTQRSHPRMARIDALLDAGVLTLRSEGFGQTRVGCAPDPAAAERTVRVWKSEGLRAEDCGEEPAAWLEDVLEVACRLVRIGPAFHRPVRPDRARPGDRVSFADAYPFLVTSEASLEDLNRRLRAAGAAAVPMTRFRPNLVLEGCDPYAEDTWHHIRIGSLVFRAGGPCARCVITTTDPLTGERFAEPLRTLASYRRDPLEPTQVNFGQNLVHETKSGRIRVGDPAVAVD